MKKNTFLFFILFVPILLNAENNVSILSFGTATSEERAIQTALRNSLEQAFGTFVSANTVIINDVLVADEIATITRGSVKSYEVLSTVVNGSQYTVNVKALVSLDDLISYATSKGSIAEYNGKAFINNVKMMRFKSENAKKALEIMVKQVKQLSKDMFDYEVELGNPIRINAQARMYGLDYSKKIDGFLIPIDILLKNNLTSSSIYKLVVSTFNAITLSEEEAEVYKKAGLPVSANITFEKTSSKYNKMQDSWDRSGYLPVNQEFCDQIKREMAGIYLEESINYKIKTVSNDPQTYIWAKWKKGQGINFYGNEGSKILTKNGHLFSYYDLDRTFWFIPYSSNSIKYVCQDNFIDARLGISNLKFIQACFDRKDPLTEAINDGYYDGGYRIEERDYFDVLIQDITYQYIHTGFYIEENKTPKELTPQEKKEITKKKKKDPNYTYIPKYDIEYAESQVLMHTLVQIYIPYNEMESFSGVKIEHR